jgi:microcystin-dependent protein
MSTTAEPTRPARRGWLKGLGALLTGGLLLSKNRVAAAPTEVRSTNVSGQIFLGEIMMVAFNFAPRGFALCNGQLLPINQNQALFALLGTSYGGNGQTTFALPDLRGRIPVSFGSTADGTYYSQGQKGGAEAHTLTPAQLPPHLHGLKVSADRGTTDLAGIAGTTPVHNYLADSGGGAPQYGGTPNATMATAGPGSTVVNTSTAVGGSQPHENMQPSLCINFVIAITNGVFPSQN